MTSGAVKLFGISAAGPVTGAMLKERPLDKLLAGVVIAGTEHFVNLVDVRPGRATGAVLALGAPGVLRGGTAGQLSAAAMGAAAAVLPDDLGERAMIGDTGARTRRHPGRRHRGGQRPRGAHRPRRGTGGRGGVRGRGQRCGALAGARLTN